MTRGMMLVADVESVDEAIETALHDVILGQALRTLHESGYDTKRAIEMMVRAPLAQPAVHKWAEEDVVGFCSSNADRPTARLDHSRP